MSTSLSAHVIDKIISRHAVAFSRFDESFPGESGRRQPVHTVYGGAHLFKPDVSSRLGKLAIRSLETFASDAAAFAAALGLPSALANAVYERVLHKLDREAVEDFRIDFEDGYGIHSDSDEDGDAVSAALTVAKGMADGTLPPFIGIRIKPLSRELYARGIRTLDLFLATLLQASGGELPENFVVTLPKISLAEQVTALVDVLDELESSLRLKAGTLKMEMMIETTHSIVSPDGRIAMPHMLASSRGRCVAAHFGAYDYTASCGITSGSQDMLHQACDFARNMMQVSLAGTGIWLSDGATNVLPVAPHRGANLTENEIAKNLSVIHAAWKLHYNHCRRSIANGIYQGWDLHPAQLPSRYAAVYTFFLEGLDEAAERLRNFVNKAARATMVGDIFDDAATGQGLLNYFLRAVNCGAVSEHEALSLTGLGTDDFRSGSFVKILGNRQSDI